MIKIGLVLSMVCIFACGAFAQSKNATSSASKDSVKPTVTVTTPAPAPKPVPLELTTGLAKVEALNGAIADLKLQSGITALENELQKQVNALFALATKDGFHYDPTIQSFVANAPEQKTKKQ